MVESSVTGVVLSNIERKIVETKANKLGLGSRRGFSAALRIIIREWNELNNREDARKNNSLVIPVTLDDAQEEATTSVQPTIGQNR